MAVAASVRLRGYDVDEEGAVTGALPNLVIAGVGKAGTTSLHWYLSQHPDICASPVKEIGYFSPLVGGTGSLPPIEDYRAHFSGCGDERYRLEASPQYFHGGRPLIESMRAVLGSPRVVLMFRDPVDRLWSQYRFMRSRLADLPEAMTFDGYVDRCLEVRRTGEPPNAAGRLYRAVQGGFYVEYLDPWVEAFGEDLRIVFFERMTASPARELTTLCEWLGLEVDVSAISFSVENRTVPVRSRALQRIALAANSERLLRHRRWLKLPLRRLYYGLNRRPSPDRMPPDTERMLRAEFAPGNRALATKVFELGYRDLPDWLSSARSDPAGRAQA
jgi:hypothetical protein